MNNIFRTSQAIMFHSWRLTCTRHYSHTNNNNEKIISIVSDISSFRTKQHQMQRRQSIHNMQFYSWSGFQQLPFNNGPLSLSLVAFKQMVPGHEIELLLHYVLQHTKHFPSVPLCRNLPFFYHFFYFILILVQGWEEVISMSVFRVWVIDRFISDYNI